MDSFQEQTLLIWDKLIEMAQGRAKSVTYGDFVKKHDLGLARDVGHKLDPIFYFCHCNELPMITDLLKNSETELPSNRPGISVPYYKELVKAVHDFDWASAIEKGNLRAKLTEFVTPPEIDSEEGRKRKRAVIFDNIKCALENTPEGELTNEIHLQMLKYADELEEMTSREFCEQAGLTDSYKTEFSKMHKMLKRLKDAGLNVDKI